MDRGQQNPYRGNEAILTENIKIVPYVISDGVPTFRDSEIKALWYRMEEEGTLKDVFYDGSIQFKEEFLKAMKGGSNFLILVYWEDQLAGIMWANRFQGRFAQWHFCCFKIVWGNKGAIAAMGKAGSDYLLYVLDLDMLVGIIPCRNERAIGAALSTGCEVMGFLPYGAYFAETNKSEQAVVVTYIKGN